ncbi:MAG TPA: DegT/DnrJ/EryC1/StrS family aminotransferase [Candidatus Sulfopaludibacter sp.]|nr:DegT/DnrJ/EryC1/StrS family aminotransferase [Candidatus Sulfopaludibacter sp.]
MIPLHDFARQWEDTREDALAAFAAVGASGWYILGREVREFEEALAHYWGIGHAVGVASGLDALEISLKALGCRSGDRVLTSPLSAFPTTLAILKLGAVPVFVDTGECGLIDLDACRAALASRPDIRFLLPVHLYGLPLDVRRLAELRDDFGCRIVEDCAQSIGACHAGKAAGTAGDMAAVSFYPTKNLAALGDGGAILTNDPALAQMARRLRDYGQSSKYVHDVAGYNSRLDELHAAYLRRVGLKRLPMWTEARRRVAAAYLAGIRNPAIRLTPVPAEAAPVWHLFPVLVDAERKADFMAWLGSHGVMCGEHYPAPIPGQRALHDVPFEVIGGLERARRICRSEVSLPIHPYLAEDETERVIAACNAWQG